KVNAKEAHATFAALHQAIVAGMVRSCHDLSEGGLAVAAAEMAFAGGIGARIELGDVPSDKSTADEANLDVRLLFSESNSRFLCEVSRDQAKEFEAKLAGVPHACIGATLATNRLEIFSAAGGADLIDLPLDELKAAWKKPLAW